LAGPLPPELLAAFGPAALEGATFVLLSPASQPVPAEPAAEAATEDAPRDEIESTIAGIWQEAFGIARIGVHDGFFQLGGDSLLATQVVARMRAALGREVTLSAFLEAQTIARLSDLCRETPEQQTGLGEFLAGLESLSTEELEALLAAQGSEGLR
jgi:acyl carrier protein